MLKGFLKIAVDGSGDMLINSGDIS